MAKLYKKGEVARVLVRALLFALLTTALTVALTGTVVSLLPVVALVLSVLVAGYVLDRLLWKEYVETSGVYWFERLVGAVASLGALPVLTLLGASLTDLPLTPVSYLVVVVWLLVYELVHSMRHAGLYADGVESGAASTARTTPASTSMSGRTVTASGR